MTDDAKDAVVSAPETEVGTEIEHLEDIKAELEELNENTAATSTWFLRGILQGAGAIIGSILMLIVLGWLLHILGLIPGFETIAGYVGTYFDRVGRY